MPPAQITAPSRSARKRSDTGTGGATRRAVKNMMPIAHTVLTSTNTNSTGTAIQMRATRYSRKPSSLPNLVTSSRRSRSALRGRNWSTTSPAATRASCAPAFIARWSFSLSTLAFMRAS